VGFIGHQSLARKACHPKPGIQYSSAWRGAMRLLAFACDTGLTAN
jgi:hypothetical protein